MKYLLTFKPLKNFFFGNDKTFKDDYVAISEYFPQNTQLLGAIRLFIAEQNNLMHVHKNGKYSNEPEKLKSLIGNANSKNFEVNDNLGMIQNLSQMFIVDKNLNDAYFTTPFDIEIGDDEIIYYQLSNIEDDYLLKNYDVKNKSDQKLGNNIFWNKYINKDSLSKNDLIDFDKVFISHNQVGIGLENKKTIDGAFYSKTDYQLDEEFLFACLIELESKIINDGIIQIGAESSIFELKIIPFEDTNIQKHIIVSQLFTLPQKGNKLVVLSDTMLENTNDLNAKFVIVPYYKNFATLDNDYEKFKGRIKEKRLIPVGTVVYVKETMPKSAIGAYSKMGYNQFITAKN